MFKILKLLRLRRKAYISEADQLILNYDRDHPTWSESQKAESQKHRNIFTRKNDYL